MFKEDKLRVSWYKEKNCYGLSRQTGSVLVPCSDFGQLIGSVLSNYEVTPSTTFELYFLPGSKERLGEEKVFTLERLVGFCNKVGKASQVLLSNKVGR